MALSRTTRVNLLIGNGHFLSHFYALCLPPMFLAWQAAFQVSFAELGLAVALMSGYDRTVADAGGLSGGSLRRASVPDRRRAADVAVRSLRWDLPPASGRSCCWRRCRAWATRCSTRRTTRSCRGSVDKDRMGRSFALHTFSGNLGFAAGAAGDGAAGGDDRLARQPDTGRAARRAGGGVHRAAERAS